MRLEMVMLAGAESKQFLVDLTKQIDRLEKLTGIAVAAKNGKAAAPAVTPAAEEEDDEELAPKKKPGKKMSDFSDEDDADDTDESESDDEEETEEEAEEFAPKKRGRPKKAAAAASFDDEEDDADEDDAEEEEKPAKATKAKKLTVDDVNDACKARMKAETGKRGCTGKVAREAVLKILTKKFGVATISELKPEQYAAAIKVLVG